MPQIDDDPKRFLVLAFQLLKDHETEVHKMRISLEVVQKYLRENTPNFPLVEAETTESLTRRDTAYALRSAQKIDDMLQILLRK